jgi:hypothetical protein
VKLRSPLTFATGPRWATGNGSPEGVVTAAIGSLYSRLDGGTDTAVYRKETGTGASGWVAVAAGGSTAPPGEELAYNQIATIVNIASVNSASPTLIIEGTSRSYDGTRIIVEFFAFHLKGPSLTSEGSYLSLWDGSTDIGYLANMFGSSSGLGGVYARRLLVPTAGTHNYRVTGFMTGSTGGSVYAGTAAAGSMPPAYIRVTRA